MEGFKGGDFPTLEVWRAELGKTTLCPDWPGGAAMSSDTSLPSSDVARLDLADVAAVADFVLSNAAAR